jgi:hypothetical protein
VTKSEPASPEAGQPARLQYLVYLSVLFLSSLLGHHFRSADKNSAAEAALLTVPEKAWEP